jgi:hypothetical protein
MNYNGARQQRCAICNKHTSKVCMICTTGVGALVPLCPQKTRGRKFHKGTVATHSCLARHRSNPARLPTKKRKREAVRATADEDSSAEEAVDEEPELAETEAEDEGDSDDE